VLPYEPSIKVPLMIRGPKIPRGVVRDQLVANVDLAPTILQYAKAKARRPLDGRSLRPVLRSPSAGLDRGILLESYFNAAGELGPGPQIVFQGVRTDRYMYARYSNGEEELYDLVTDPFELQSRHADPAFAGIKGSLAALLARLQACSGASCRAAGG
jgi:arylsulfatase A-like enzyme